MTKPRVQKSVGRKREGIDRKRENELSGQRIFDAINALGYGRSVPLPGEYSRSERKVIIGIECIRSLILAEIKKLEEEYSVSTTIFMPTANKAFRLAREKGLFEALDVAEIFAGRSSHPIWRYLEYLRRTTPNRGGPTRYSGLIRALCVGMVRALQKLHKQSGAGTLTDRKASAAIADRLSEFDIELTDRRKGGDQDAILDWLRKDGVSNEASAQAERFEEVLLTYAQGRRARMERYFVEQIVCLWEPVQL